MTTQAHEFAHANAERFRQQLMELVRIPSVSAYASTHAGEVRRAAEWIANDMRRIGVQNVELLPTGGNPVVFGEWLSAGANAPTVLMYGHYDVQPAAMKDGWSSEPFEPIIREDGFMYARGSSDDKGQMFTHIKAVESILATRGKLPVNVKFLIEGEEEVGSKNLESFIAANVERLKADVCVISDTGFMHKDQPVITYALRGLTYMEIHVWGPKQDLHSGGYGGIVHNPALALVQILSKMHNADNSVAVPGFYDDVKGLSAEEREAMKATDISIETLKADTGVSQAWGEAAYTLRERIGARPTLEINGLYSGHIEEGAKTVLPARAMAKVSCRLVANQNSVKIYELVRDYVASLTPPTVRSEVKLLNRGEPALTPIDTPAMNAAIRAYEQGWGKAPLFLREGGSIPVVSDFQKYLHTPVLMMGFGLNNDGAHGPDEHYSMEMFHKGIDTMIYLFDEIGAQGK